MLITYQWLLLFPVPSAELLLPVGLQRSERAAAAVPFLYFFGVAVPVSSSALPAALLVLLYSAGQTRKTFGDQFNSAAAAFRARYLGTSSAAVGIVVKLIPNISV